MHVLRGMLTKKLKYRNQTTQNKCMCFCLQLRKLKYISHEKFERLNWLPVTYRIKQCAKSIVFKCFSEECPNYLKKVFDTATYGYGEQFSMKWYFSKIKLSI